MFVSDHASLFFSGNVIRCSLASHMYDIDAESKRIIHCLTDLGFHACPPITSYVTAMCRIHQALAEW